MTVNNTFINTHVCNQIKTLLNGTFTRPTGDIYNRELIQKKPSKGKQFTQ